QGQWLSVGPRRSRIGGARVKITHAIGRRRQEDIGPALEGVQRRQWSREAARIVAFKTLAADSHAPWPAAQTKLRMLVTQIKVRAVAAVIPLLRHFQGEPGLVCGHFPLVLPTQTKSLARLRRRIVEI